jgi:hypothetical protein
LGLCPQRLYTDVAPSQFQLPNTLCLHGAYLGRMKAPSRTVSVSETIFQKRQQIAAAAFVCHSKTSSIARWPMLSHPFSKELAHLTFEECAILGTYRQ